MCGEVVASRLRMVARKLFFENARWAEAVWDGDDGLGWFGGSSPGRFSDFAGPFLGPGWLECHGWYGDPEEVEKQQAEEAAAKNAVAGDVEGAPAEWDISSAPQAGAINPALVSEDGGEHL
jgi:hypothetical protein